MILGAFVQFEDILPTCFRLTRNSTEAYCSGRREKVKREGRFTIRKVDYSLHFYLHISIQLSEAVI